MLLPCHAMRISPLPAATLDATMLIYAAMFTVMLLAISPLLML